MNRETPAAGVAQAPGGRRETRGIPEVETALGRDLLPLLGNQCRLVGMEPAGKRENLLTGGELQVEHRGDPPAQRLDVRVLDVPAILAEMGRDAVGARPLGEQRGGDGIGLIGPPGLPDGRDVIDIDVEPHRCHCSAVVARCMFRRPPLLTGVPA
jgi:hypothetical protein